MWWSFLTTFRIHTKTAHSVFLIWKTHCINTHTFVKDSKKQCGCFVTARWNTLSRTQGEWVRIYLCTHIVHPPFYALNFFIPRKRWNKIYPFTQNISQSEVNPTFMGGRENRNNEKRKDDWASLIVRQTRQWRGLRLIDRPNVFPIEVASENMTGRKFGASFADKRQTKKTKSQSHKKTNYKTPQIVTKNKKNQNTTT